MTIDIIEAAKADRQTKLDQILALKLDVIEIDAFIAKARAYAGDGETDTTAPNPLPEGEVNPSPNLDTPAEAKTVDQEPLSNGSGGVQDECAIHPANPMPTTPQPATKYERVLEALRKNPKANARALATISGCTISTAKVYLLKARGEIADEQVHAAPESATPATKTKKQMIFDAHQEHPDWWAEKIADETGIALATVRSYASGFKLKLPPKPWGGQSKATKAILATGKPQGAKKPVVQAVEAKEPETRPTIPNEPIWPVHNVVRQRPKGTMFRLRNEDGLFLHCDLNAMIRKGLRFVGKHEYPWEGSERQLLAVRKMLPATIDLREEVITNG